MRCIIKRCISLSICFVMVLGVLNTGSIAYAQDTESNAFINDQSVTDLAQKYSSLPVEIDNDTVFIPLSNEKNIEFIAQKNNISYTKAQDLVNNQNIMSRQSDSKLMKASNSGAYEDLTGVMLKRFSVVSGLSTNCTVIAAINVMVRVYWEIAYNEREFITVYDTGITMLESGVWTWATNTVSAVIMSNGKINLNASGTISGTISGSLSASYKAFGFSVGTNYYSNKFQTISYIFDPKFEGAVLN